MSRKTAKKEKRAARRSAEALAGAPLRPETFVFMMRRGGPFYLPVDIAAYVQGRWFNRKPSDSWDHQTSWAVGARYLATRNLEVSFQYLSEQEVYGPREEESVLQLQFRYRTLQ